MRFRILVGSLVLIALATAGAYATSGAGVAPVRQWAIVHLQKPTLIAGRFVMGSVMFVHDEQKMAAGLPCTEVYRFEPGKGPTELVTAFYCIPRARNAATTFTLSTKSSPDGSVRLTEYQFAGDGEGHGVPVSESARPDAPQASACCTSACCAESESGGCCGNHR